MHSVRLDLPLYILQCETSQIMHPVNSATLPCCHIVWSCLAFLNESMQYPKLHIKAVLNCYRPPYSQAIWATLRTAAEEGVYTNQPNSPLQLSPPFLYVPFPPKLNTAGTNVRHPRRKHCQTLQYHMTKLFKNTSCVEELVERKTIILGVLCFLFQLELNAFITGQEASVSRVLLWEMRSQLSLTEHHRMCSIHSTDINFSLAWSK